MEGIHSRGASLWDSVTPALQKLLQKPFHRNDPAAFPLWKKYLATHSRVAADRLYEFYLPFVRVGVFKQFSSRPWLFTDGIGDMVSDGFLALRRVIELADSFDPDHFRCTLFLAIRRYIFRGREAMDFGSFHRIHARRVLSAIRSTLTCQLGRLPEREEILRELRRQVQNPSVHIAYIDEHPVKVLRFSELENPSIDRPVEVADPTADDPSERAIASDLMRRTMNLLEPRDRKILRLTLRGESQTAIARRLGISRERVRQLLNGIIWEARSRAELATYSQDGSTAIRSAFERGKHDALPSASRLLSA
ncbi:MAG: sigma-70 family RNA polymerase sigma factor [Tepidisphaeraceae bacterium]